MHFVFKRKYTQIFAVASDQEYMSLGKVTLIVIEGLILCSAMTHVLEINVYYLNLSKIVISLPVLQNCI